MSLTMRITHVGGSFAPPLSDELLAKYRGLIDNLPESQIKEAMTALLRCCAAWWDLPEPSVASTRPHPVGPRKDSATGKVRRAPLITDLQADHAAQLDPHIPWKRELELYADLFEGIQTAEAQRNGMRSEAWLSSVREAFIAQEYTPEEAVWLRSKERKALRAVMSALGNFDGISNSLIDSVLAAFGTSKAKLEEEATKMKKVEAAVAAVKAGGLSPVPRPAQESTALRDAAKHLLWHVNELDLGREPLTSEQL